MSDPCLVEINPPFTGWDWHICRDEDINDPLPQFLAADGGPYNLSGKTVEVLIRPTYDHAEMIKRLSSILGGITIDNAAQGLCSAYMARATVQTDIPVGDWVFMLVINDGAYWEEFARGPFRVHAGQTGGA